ncbi:hypothetical protein MMC11_001791 [Xylographa trunciseda]|nr:hypothetical protein [Xylographa trunciseda]
MSSIFKGSMGKNSNKASEVAPPSYATRPPKDHQKASNMIDSEEDDQATQTSQGGRGRTQQVYDIDSDDEEVSAQSSRLPLRARNHGGQSKIEHAGADNHDERHTRPDPNRRGTSQALVQREQSRSDEEPGPSTGYRSEDKSKKISTSRGDGKRQGSGDEETVIVERFRRMEWQELWDRDIALLTKCLGITMRKLKDHCDDGKIRYDRKSNYIDYELLYPFFPPHRVHRLEDGIKKLKKASKETKEMNEAARGGRTTVETRFVVPPYMPYKPDHELDYLPYCELHRPNYGSFSYLQLPDPNYRSFLSFDRSDPNDRHDPTNRYCECTDCLL